MSGYSTYGQLTAKETDNTTPPCMEIQNIEHRQKLLKQNHIVCIDVFGHWCRPCKMIEPKFAELAQKYNNPGTCMLVKEDVDLELTRDQNIAGVPAFLFYRMGHPMKNPDGTTLQVVGGDINKVEEILRNLIADKQPQQNPIQKNTSRQQEQQRYSQQSQQHKPLQTYSGSGQGNNSQYHKNG